MARALNHASLAPKRSRFQGVAPLPKDAEFLTGDELAARLRVSLSTVYRWAARGLIQPVRVGGATRWPVSILDDAAAGKLAEGGR